MELKDTVAVITGAARGIGKAVATAYARHGVRLALVDILGEQVKQAASELESTGAEVLAIPTDITDIQQVNAMADTIRDRFGSPDILINNAGSLTAIGPAWSVDPIKWARDVTVNLIGTFWVTRALLPDMVAQKRGYIINLVGAAVGKAHLYTTGYDSSKAGVVRVTEAIAQEATEHGIKTFVITPGAVATEMTRFIRESEEGRKWRPTFDSIFAEGRDVPIGRIVEWCVQLVSGRADALTGRWVSATEDFEQTIQRSGEILTENLNVLRLRKPE